MIRTNPGAKLTVHLTLDGCRLRVDGSAATNGDGHDGEVAMPGAVRSLLAMSTDEWDFSASGGRAHFAFVVSPSASMR
jgi:hypothetical protein